VAERMRDMPTKLSRLFSVMQKLRDLPLFQLTRGNRSGGSLLCKRRGCRPAPPQGAAPNSLGRSGKLPFMVGAAPPPAPR
jgi:hypothetical protein